MVFYVGWRVLSFFFLRVRPSKRMVTPSTAHPTILMGRYTRQHTNMPYLSDAVGLVIHL